MPQNPRYAEIHDALVPADRDGPARAQAEATLAAWRAAHGLKAFQGAFAGGQYSFPDGLFFGGRAPTWSNATFRAVVQRHGAGAKRVAVIDIHTGPGPRGYGEPISVVLPVAAEFQRARAWWGASAATVPSRS